MHFLRNHQLSFRVSKIGLEVPLKKSNETTLQLTQMPLEFASQTSHAMIWQW
jgi:hypothetical protein